MCGCDDPPDVYRETVRRARKPHRCCECSRTIAAGERYQYASGVWDGRGDAFKTCIRCAALRRAVVEVDEACPVFGDLIGGALPYFYRWAYSREHKAALAQAARKARAEMRGRPCGA